MSTDAIADAVALLRSRREETLTEIGRLQGEVTRIDGALSSLTGAPTTPRVQPATTSPPPKPIEPGGQPITITQAIVQATNSIDKWWSIDDLVRELAALQGDRTDEQLRGTIRTALWNLRKRDLIVSDKGRHKAKRYTRGTTTDAETAADTAVSETPIPTSEEGGGSHETAKTSPSVVQFHDHLGASASVNAHGVFS